MVAIDRQRKSIAGLSKPTAVFERVVRHTDNPRQRSSNVLPGNIPDPLRSMSIPAHELPIAGGSQSSRLRYTARDSRWKRPYTELTFLPMIEVLKYLRANGYRTYIVTGGGQDFVRVYSEEVYGIPPEQMVGTKYGYNKEGKPFLTKEPELLLNDDNAGKPEGIHLVIGRRPYAAFGNSTGDRQMLEYTKAGEGERLAMLVLHGDAKHEYAYGPALGVPDTKVGTFTETLYDEAKKKGWIVICECRQDSQ
jgi:haloacid dehalogenase-like hydrolase